MRRGQRAVERFPHHPPSGRSHGSPPRAAFPYDPSVALPTRRPTDRATVITDTDAPGKSRGTEGWLVSLESPLLSRVVRLLSFGTGDPRLPTFPLARSVPGQSGDTRPFVIVLQETLARIDVGSPRGLFLPLARKFFARLHVFQRCFVRHPLTALVITGFHERKTVQG